MERCLVKVFGLVFSSAILRMVFDAVKVEQGELPVDVIGERVTVVGGEGLREELLLSVLLKRNCDNDVLG